MRPSRSCHDWDLTGTGKAKAKTTAKLSRQRRGAPQKSVPGTGDSDAEGTVRLPLRQPVWRCACIVLKGWPSHTKKWHQITAEFDITLIQSRRLPFLTRAADAT